MQRKYLSIISFSLFILMLSSCETGNHSLIEKDYSRISDVEFNYHIKPLLSDRCFACHGPDKNTRKADLSLHEAEGAFQTKLESGGYAIVPGDLKASEAYQRMISDDPDKMMPPPESNLSLTEEEKKLIAKWIKQGAKWEKHWSFIPPKSRKIPLHSYESWTNNRIDDFIAHRLERNRLRPAYEAPKEKLLRRVTFDLTGLPPTIEEMQAFLADNSQDAYEKVVDRLLASPAYGERMTSLWLDAARYSDSHGYQDDRPRTMWPWRDWVIKAFNENMPYDKFGTWQLAGDLLPNATYEQKLATGFNRNHGITQEGGVIEEEYLTEYAADRTQTFSTVFLGLTLQCARCHDHKYDPISQKDFYQLFAFFNNIPERGQISYFDEAPVPSMKVQDPLLDSTITEIKEQITFWEQQESILANHSLQIRKNEKEPIRQLVQKDYEEWLKKEWLKEEWTGSKINDRLSDGLLVWVDFDDKKFPFINRIGSGQIGKMNINLPPAIDIPELQNGHTGRSLSFNGKNFLSMGETGDFDHYHEFSLGAWINHSNQHDRNAGILSRRVGEQKRQGYDLVLTENNKLGVRLFHDTREYFLSVETLGRIAPDTWTHVFATYDGSGKAKGISLYINGEKQRVNIIKDNLQHKSILNGNDFLIGNWNHRARVLGDLYGFNGGKIDGIRLYNRRLSPIEVSFIIGRSPVSTIKDMTLSQNVFEHYLINTDSTYQKVKEKLDSLRALDQQVPNVMIMEELDTVKTTYWLARGVYDAKMDPVQRSTPEVILAFNENLPKNRLGLAQWVFDDRNPLTARVAVNRFWQMIFGRGLVDTPEDFGNQGGLPSHPWLLDWLSVEFVESGWDVKALVRLMVTSATYRQSTQAEEELLTLDPDNILLARGPYKRLAAEMMRDQALAISGLLTPKLGGKWVKPYQPAGLWKEMANQIGENKYRPGSGQDLYRRSIYTYWKRTIPPPDLLLFDAPERTQCEVKRQSTNTPLQALLRLNAPIYMETSRKMAEKLLENYTSPEEQIQAAFMMATSRKAKEKEVQLLKTLYESEKNRFTHNLSEAEALLQVGVSPVASRHDKDQLAALAVVINTIMNLEEAKYRG